MEYFNYQIIGNTNVLSQKGEWSKEFNFVSWNNEPAKYEIRTWNRTADGEFARKGITLSFDEVIKLRNLLIEMFTNTDHQVFYSLDGIEYISTSTAVTPYDIQKARVL